MINILFLIIFLILIIFIIFIINDLNLVDNQILIDQNLVDNQILIDQSTITNIYNKYVHVDSKKYTNFKITYGEMTWEGMTALTNYLDKINFNKKTFIDLGCGNGKLMIMAIANGFNKAKGTEITSERYLYALEKLNQFNYNIADKITLLNNNIFDLDDDFFEENSVIFISNLCFDDKTNNDIFNFLQNKIKYNSLVFVSRKPSNIANFVFVDSINIPMSWNTTEICYIYKL